MKKLLLIVSLIFFVSFPLSLRAEGTNITLKDESSDIAVLSRDKKIMILFFNDLDPYHKLQMNFDLSKKNKLRDYLEWKKKGVMNKTIQKTRIRIIETQKGKRKKKIKDIKDKNLKMAYLEAFRRLHYPDGVFFYLLSKEGKVVEIQGVDDYLSVLYATMGGSIPGVTFVRNQISLFALRDIFGIDNESSKRLAAKLHMANPFFLTLDDALSGIKLAVDLYKYATRDQRAFKLLNLAPTNYDKCLLFLTDPGARALKASKKGFEAAWNACKAVPNPSIQIAKAMGRALFLNVFVKALTEQDFEYAQKVIQEHIKDARSLAEQKRMQSYLVAIKALKKMR